MSISHSLRNIATVFRALVDNDDNAAHAAVKIDCSDWNHVRDAVVQARVQGGPGAAEKMLVALQKQHPDLMRLCASNGNGEATESDPFDGHPPIPLHDLALPLFPVDALPEPLCQFVKEASVSFQVPPDLVAIPVLGVTALCLTKRIEVCIKSDWSVSVNLWLVIVYPSGGRKTSVLNYVTRPLIEWERQEADRVAPEIEKAKARKRVLEEAANQAIREAAKDAHDPTKRQAAENASVDASGVNIPPLPQLFTGDATPEALVKHLAEQAGRFAIVASEPRFLEALQQYNRAGENIPLASILECYGDVNIRRSRATTRYISIDRPALTIIMAVQPRILTGLLGKEAFVTSGFTGRVLWSLPKSNIGYRDVDPPPISNTGSAAYRDLVLNLLSIAPANPEKPERVIAFTPDARRVFLAFAQDIEKRQLPGGDLEGITEWASKAPGVTARIAGVLHSVRRVAAGDCPGAVHIDQESVERAIAIMEYSIPHALAAHDLIAGVRGDPRAERLVEWVIRHPADEFTARDAFIALRGIFRRMDALNPVLALLEQHNYIAPVVRPTNGRGRPSRIYRINRNRAHYRI